MLFVQSENQECHTDHLHALLLSGMCSRKDAECSESQMPIMQLEIRRCGGTRNSFHEHVGHIVDSWKSVSVVHRVNRGPLQYLDRGETSSSTLTC